MGGLLKSAFTAAAKGVARVFAREGVEQTATTGARVATREVAEQAATVGARTAATTTAAVLNSPITWKRIILGNMAVTAAFGGAVLGAKIYEHESGGAILDAAVDGAVEGLRELRDQGILTPENMDEYADNVAYGLDVLGAFDKSLQNQVVQAAMDGSENPTEEQINRGQVAAAGWLLKPDNAIPLLVQHRIRASVIDDLYDDPNEADAHLARSFIDDIKEAAHVQALDGHQLDDSDVVAALREHNVMESSFLSNRLRNGLTQLYPELERSPMASEFSAVAPNRPAPVLSAQEQLEATLAAAQNNIQNAGLASIFQMGVIGTIFKYIVEAVQELDKLSETFGLNNGQGFAATGTVLDHRTDLNLLATPAAPGMS